MTSCTKVTIEADVGATLNSPNFFDIEEIVPPNTTIADIEAGILDGSYTPIDPNLYTYEGKVKADYNQAELNTLNLSVSTVTIAGTVTGGTNTYEVVTFKIPPAETTAWENEERCLMFDVKRTEIADPTNIDIWVRGTIKVNPVITE